jgi:threonyl-tRNA synthetase
VDHTVRGNAVAADHRELGRDMGVFVTSPLVGPGLPLWLPAGAAVRRELESSRRGRRRRGRL